MSQVNLTVFEARSNLGHFRRPDTLATHATYPFITRTALRGLAASILGRDSLPDPVRCGIQILTPVRTNSQQLSLHGKSWTGGGAEASFSRPTTLELLVKPSYRCYYAGPLADELAEALERQRSRYHTYLGVAYCLTFPALVARMSAPVYAADAIEPKTIRCLTVLPEEAVTELIPEPEREYARVGGVPYAEIGGRRFRGSVNVFYEVNGNPITFLPRPAPADLRWLIVDVGEGMSACLW